LEVKPIVTHDYFVNPLAAREGCRGIFSQADYAAVAAFFASFPRFPPTPLHRLPGLARRLGLRGLAIKDESRRMGLNAFKGVGAAYAIDRLMAGRPEGDRPVLVCASAGNHGRAVAHAGAARGLDVIVYMSAATAAGPRQAIEGEGARVVLVDGTYDDAVRRASADAAASGALVVSDTAWPGYEAIPHDIMAGYTRIFDEARDVWDETPNLAIVQAGVGSLAAAAAAWWSDRFGVERPCFVCCEPRSADPLLQSARAGRATTSTQPLDTIMSGLRCSQASSLAVPILLRAADVFVSIDDALTREAMRLLARPVDGDPPIVAGPSGAAGLGALLAIRDRERHRGASVLLVNTEGATDRALYDEIVGDRGLPRG
jgi:diaminopropionate ammonia-lyase